MLPSMRLSANPCDDENLGELHQDAPAEENLHVVKPEVFPHLRTVWLRAFSHSPGTYGRGPFIQRRKPPVNASAFSPWRQPLGSFLSSFTLPPPRTISSGSSAVARRPTTSKTYFPHLFLPHFFSPRTPT